MEFDFEQIKHNFKAYDYECGYKALNEMYKKEPSKQKVMYVFAGANGSGKSTLIANLYRQGLLDTHYINADLVARENMHQITGDQKCCFDAMNEAISMVKDYIKEGNSFCYETVLSHPSKFELVNLAKKNGYKVISVFVSTKSPNINLGRVSYRKKQGGHDVVTAKIIARYNRAMENKKVLQVMSDEYYEFDNSHERKIIKASDLNQEICQQR
ncbi:MAG: zeta toxin family protein [Clostridia bacterium]|nr:zeta toxin family protein [Clostridia bacterium]